MVTRIDRLARSIGDLQDIVRAVRALDPGYLETLIRPATPLT